MRCMDCRHFDVMGTGEKGQRYGMCRAWRFSINENDGRTCKKKELKNDCEPGAKIDTPTREGFSHA